MIVLLSNDDGIHSDGIIALENSLQHVGEVYTVAPDREQNSMSHALTLHRPLRVLDMGPRRFAVDGTPTDCVKLALTGLLPVRPDLVVSGINKGPNLGDDIIYSGTVSAAIEGALLGIPAIAVSLVTFENFQFQTAADFAATLVSRIQEKGMPLETLLNVNVPPLPKEQIKGWRLTRQGKRHYSENIVERTDRAGRNTTGLAATIWDSPMTTAPIAWRFTRAIFPLLPFKSILRTTSCCRKAMYPILTGPDAKR
jgi:5'-nucleotidase